MSENREPMTLPLLPLRDVVVFPHMVIPLFVGRAKSIKALEAAMETAKQIMLVAQKSAQKDEPGIEDLYDVGCIATVLQMLKLPDGTVKVLVEGQQRARVLEALDGEAFMTAEVKPLPAAQNEDTEAEALRRALLQQFEQFVKLNKKIPPEVMASLTSMDDAGRLADSVASHLPLKIEQKQEVLEMQSATARLEHLLGVLETEIDILQVEKRIRGRVKRQMEKSQREYYLNEQVKAIQKELGDGEETAELDVLDKKIKTSGISKEGREKAEAELKKLRLMSPMSAEATVVRNYLDALIGLPWKKKSKISTDLAKAEEVLNDDHFGLDKVKERILEYLAVQQRVDKIKAPILCLVGPPGVGKTSLGQSIAKATNRKFVRLSLGGVRDESEIRGHRRTYIGSMPGRILQSLSKVGVRNPLFLLDEVDKMGMDFRGDPASALLEVLDPEQNHTFSDHYVEVDFDLSDVMFVATANSMNMPAPLLDRMEIIRLSGYTESEKVNIAQQYLLSKQLKNNGIQEGEVNVDVTALRSIIRYYTREAGVRSLEREISKLCRKVVRKVVLAKSKGEKIAKIDITDKNLADFLGVQKYTFGMAEKDNQIGQVNGLAWTEVGGDLLTVEVAVVGGKGATKFTGKLGDVMQESVSAALTVVRKRAQRLGIQPSFHEKHDLHVHFPEGAIPKDGPSAGIAIATALVSALTEIPVRADVAMTGEITLRGEVLPIGGLKEKLLAAMRGGIKKVLIPHENVKDLSEMPQEVLSNLEIQPVRWIDEVLIHALERAPVALTDDQILPPVTAVAAAAAVSATSAATKH